MKLSHKKITTTTLVLTGLVLVNPSAAQALVNPSAPQVIVNPSAPQFIVNPSAPQFIVNPSAPQVFELTTTEKLQLVAGFAQAQDLFFLSGFLDGDAKNQGIQTGFLDSSGFSLKNLRGTIKDTDYTANYFGTFDSNSDLISWTMTGNYGQKEWSSSGTALFQNNNEEIILNSNASINPDFSGGITATLRFGGGQKATWDIGLTGRISDKVGSRGGTYNIEATLSKNSEEGVSTELKGKYEETSSGVSKKIGVGVKTTRNGNELNIEAGAESVPEPLTILGTGVALTTLPIFKKEYKKRKRKAI
jgi:hypothetical protein